MLLKWLLRSGGWQWLTNSKFVRSGAYFAARVLKKRKAAAVSTSARRATSEIWLASVLHAASLVFLTLRRGARMAANGPDSELPTPTKPVPTVPRCAPSLATARVVCSSQIVKNRPAALELSFDVDDQKELAAEVKKNGDKPEACGACGRTFDTPAAEKTRKPRRVSVSRFDEWRRRDGRRARRLRLVWYWQLGRGRMSSRSLPVIAT